VAVSSAGTVFAKKGNDLLAFRLDFFSPRFNHNRRAFASAFDLSHCDATRGPAFQEGFGVVHNLIRLLSKSFTFGGCFPLPRSIL
jgi:hypothetical protein